MLLGDHVDPLIDACATVLQMATLGLVFLLIFAGFAIVRVNIPDYWIWAFYATPLSWSLQAIVINEMSQDRWSEPYANPVTGPNGLTNGLHPYLM